MRIKVGEYLITSDPYNFILNRTSVNSKPDSARFGEITTHPIGYYGSMRQALHAIPEIELKKSDCESFAEVLAKLEQIHQDIENREEAEDEA